MQSKADLCSQATSFVQYKKRMANALTLKTYVKELATHFLLRMRDWGAEIASDARTQFTLEGPSKQKRATPIAFED